jgi:hypothetical protein
MLPQTVPVAIGSRRGNKNHGLPVKPVHESDEFLARLAAALVHGHGPVRPPVKSNAF